MPFERWWGGPIATTSRFTVTFGEELGGRVVWALGYTGLGVATTRFAARVLTDKLLAPDSGLLDLAFTSIKPVPFPPEPLRWAGVNLTRRAIGLDHGEGRDVWDAQGTRYLDLFGGILTTMSAHALAERIAELAPMPDAKVFFTTSGAEANEVALLLACTARRSQQVLALRNSYHGRSFATMAVTGNRGWSASALPPVNVKYVPGGYCLRSPYRLDDAGSIEACVEDLGDVLVTQTAGDVACLIAEPIQGVGGFVTPEILTFATGLGNGRSMAGVVARAELMDSITANSVSTFGGNPLVCAGADANLTYLLDNDLPGNAALDAALSGAPERTENRPMIQQRHDR